jgi:hypothetical protein
MWSFDKILNIIWTKINTMIPLRALPDKSFDAVVRIDTPGEADYFRHGGIMRVLAPKKSAKPASTEMLDYSIQHAKLRIVVFVSARSRRVPGGAGNNSEKEREQKQRQTNR